MGTAAQREGKKAKKRKVPPYLIKEWVQGIPVYYKGYRDVLDKTKTPEEIMADGLLQAILKNWLHLLLGNRLDLNKYWVLAGEISSHLSHRKNATHDLVVFEKSLLPAAKISNQYAAVPAKIIVEIDTEVEYGEDFPVEQYVQTKTQQSLDFGTEKVIWIFTATQKVLVATPDADWTISPWSKTIEVLDGVTFNLAEFIAQEGIVLE